MFFLAFILFAALIVWLVMNGLNEMRWVQAHSHDEEVAADPGIIPSRAEISNAGEKLKEKTQAAFQEDGALGKAKQKAQEAMQDDGILGKAKQKLKDGDYVNKAKDLSKNAGDKLKDASASARSKMDNTNS